MLRHNLNFALYFLNIIFITRSLHKLRKKVRTVKPCLLACLRSNIGNYHHHGLYCIVCSSSEFNSYDLKGSAFGEITPCSPLKANRRFGGTCRIHLHDRRINQTRNQYEAGIELWLTLKMEATYFFETSVKFQEITWRYVTEDRTLHSHSSENLKFVFLTISSNGWSMWKCWSWLTHRICRCPRSSFGAR
jgi:hypothetical protein